MTAVQSRHTVGLSDGEILERNIRESAGVGTTALILPEIVGIISEMPQDVTSLIPSTADYLAGRFLTGINLCGELLALALGHELKTDTLKKKEFSLAFHVRAASRNCRTIKDKEHYPYMDDAYLAAEDKATEAKIFRQYVEGKLDTLEKAHYHMRKIADKDPAAGYKPSEFFNKEEAQQVRPFYQQQDTSARSSDFTEVSWND